MKEIWQDIEGYEGLYEICTDGRVRNLRKGIYMKMSKYKTGYLYVGLTKNDKQIKYKQHRLIADAFIPKIDGRDFINHINGIRDDNRICNLEWVNQRENCTHREIGKGTSKFPGVCWDKGSNKWRPQVTLNGKKFHLGRYHCEMEAYEAALKYKAEHNIENKYQV